MLKIIFYLFCAAVLVSFSSGCADSEGAPTEPVEDASGEDVPQVPVGPLTLENFPDAYAAMMCERVYACCNDEELLRGSGGYVFESEANCHAFYVEKMVEELAKNDVPRAAGRMGFSAENAETCLEETRVAGCGVGLITELIQTDACTSIDAGLMEAGEECAAVEECRSKRCSGVKFNRDGGIDTMGICGAVVGLGEACELDADCRDGTICSAKYNPETGERVGVCQKHKVAGEPCSSARECEAENYCTVYLDNGSGHASIDGVCAPLLSAGDICDTWMQCLSETCERSDLSNRDLPRTCRADRWACSGRDE